MKWRLDRPCHDLLNSLDLKLAKPSLDKELIFGEYEMSDKAEVVDAIRWDRCNACDEGDAVDDILE